MSVRQENCGCKVILVSVRCVDSIKCSSIRSALWSFLSASAGAGDGGAWWCMVVVVVVVVVVVEVVVVV